MILGIKKLRELVQEMNLVENLCERELNNPEGAGFDLRLGEIFELTGEGFLGIDDRSTPTAIQKGKYDPDKKENENYFIFESKKYYLIKTIEKINLPVTLSGIIFPRTTMFRSGLGLFNGIVQPGYCGELTFGICNLGASPIKISFGARIVHITFHEVLGEGNQYRGQWQGGRVSTNGKETQV
ncbi:MAG: hypothetical protein V1655_01605 [bacterium]